MKNIGFGAHGRSRGPVRDEIIELQKLSNENTSFGAHGQSHGPVQIKKSSILIAIFIKKKVSELMTRGGGRSDTKNHVILERFS